MRYELTDLEQSPSSRSCRISRVVFHPCIADNATRYDKLAANYLSFVKLASIRIWLR